MKILTKARPYVGTIGFVISCEIDMSQFLEGATLADADAFLLEVYLPDGTETVWTPILGDYPLGEHLGRFYYKTGAGELDLAGRYRLHGHLEFPMGFRGRVGSDSFEVLARWR